MSFGRSGSKPPLRPRGPVCRRQAAAALAADLDLCRIGKQAEADRDAVPAVDDIDHQGELDLLLLGELRLQGLIGALARSCPSESRVNASVQPSAARSRSV